MRTRNQDRSGSTSSTLNSPQTSRSKKFTLNASWCIPGALRQRLSHGPKPFDQVESQCRSHLSPLPAVHMHTCSNTPFSPLPQTQPRIAMPGCTVSQVKVSILQGRASLRQVPSTDAWPWLLRDHPASFGTWAGFKELAPVLSPESRLNLRTP